MPSCLTSDIMVVGDSAPVSDVVFIVEGTANLGAYFDVIKTSYILPTLAYFNGGPPDDIDYGYDFSCTMYSLVVFTTGDAGPEPLVTCSFPTTNTHKFIKLLDNISFVGGGSEACSHISEGLSTALQVFDDFKTLRDVNTSTQKHCILVCNSPPYQMASMESMNYSGYTAEQLVNMLAERSVHFSVMSPRKIPILHRLYDLGCGDIQVSPLKNFTTDSRHLVLLHGYQLQERPQSPSHDSKDGVKSGDVKASVTSSPAKPGDSPATGYLAHSSPASGASGDGTFKIPSSNITTQQQGQVMSPGGLMVQSQLSSAGQQQQQFQSQDGQLRGAGQNPGAGGMGPRGPQGQVRPNMPGNMGMPRGPNPGNIQQPNQGQVTRPPPPDAARVVAQKILTEAYTSAQSRKPQQPQQNLAPGQNPMMQAQQVPILQRQNAMVSVAQISQNQAHLSQQGMVSQAQMNHPQLMTSQQNAQTMMTSQPAQSMPGAQNVMISQPQQQQQQQQHLANQQQGLMASTQMNQPPYSNPGQISQPIMQQDPSLTPSTAPSMGQPGMMTGGLVDSIDGLNPAVALEQARQQQSQQQKKIIWTGALEWHEKTKGQTQDPNAKVTRSLACHVSTNPGETDINANKWPSKLIMQLIPQSLLAPLQGLFRNSRTVAFHFANTDIDSLKKLYTVMASGFAGCVHFPSVTQCEVRVLMLLYSNRKKQFMGLIPNDQASFVNGIRQVINNHKKIQAERMQQQKMMVPQHGMPPQQGNPPQFTNPPMTSPAQQPMGAGNMGMASTQGGGIIMSQVSNSLNMTGGQVHQTAPPISMEEQERRQQIQALQQEVTALKKKQEQIDQMAMHKQMMAQQSQQAQQQQQQQHQLQLQQQQRMHQLQQQQSTNQQLRHLLLNQQQQQQLRQQQQQMLMQQPRTMAPTGQTQVVPPGGQPAMQPGMAQMRGAQSYIPEDFNLDIM